MKKARTAEGQEIIASAEAPEEAICPVCGHPVSLRKRRLMTNRGYVYFWRHKLGGNLSCKKRSRHISGRKSSR